MAEEGLAYTSTFKQAPQMSLSASVPPSPRFNKTDIVWILGTVAAAVLIGLAARFSTVAALVMTGAPWASPDANPVNLYLLSNLAFALAFSLISILGALCLIRRRSLSRHDIGLRASQPIWYAVGGVAFLVLSVTNSAAGYWLNEHVPTARRFLGLLALPYSCSLIWAAVFGLCVQPIWIFVHELVWRGLAYRWLRERSTAVVAIIVSASLSAWPSLLYIGQNSAVAAYLASFYFLMGAISGILLQMSKSLWPVISAAIVAGLALATLHRLAL
ncbi:CPBP family intramembrane glutamic endopeptidase [Hypericibacter terrae]|uniref:CPBP family intramembrane glutamic endopeptidase n=1 Tax=Hypericibacter terrae TaxID=2602015 RepID=UPI001243E9DC|nr:CPBP family intramembrane glutamic endopeptidase [Hypericibacter terrae]